MEATATFDAHLGPDHAHRIAKNGMKIFLFSEAMLFAGLIAGYMILRAGVPAWPPADAPSYRLFPLHFMQILMICNTVLLFSSSFTYHMAEVRMKKGRSGILWLLFTVLLGSVFLSLQAYEWMHLKHEGLWVNTYGVFGSSFFVLTGFHGLHVFIGVMLIVVAALRAALFKLRKAVSPSAVYHHNYEECVGLYWHFVDVVWIFLFLVLYVL